MKKLSKENINELFQTLFDLKAFNASVKQYGLTKSLMSFADYNKNLSSCILTIPSLESLNTDISIENSKFIVAAVENKISELFNHIKEKIKKFTDYFAKQQLTLLDIDKKLKEYVNRIHNENRIFVKENAPGWEDCNSLIEFKELILGFQLIQKSQDIITEIFKLKPPFSEEEYLEWISKIKELMHRAPNAFPEIINLNGKFEINDDYMFFSPEDFDHCNNITRGYDSIDKIKIISDGFTKTISSLHGHMNLYVESENIINKMESSIKNDTLIHNVSEILMHFIYDDIQIFSWLKHWPLAGVKELFSYTEIKKV